MEEVVGYLKSILDRGNVRELQCQDEREEGDEGLKHDALQTDEE
jgi:hypothetical protein